MQKRALKKAFSSAAEKYDSYALLQRETADRLIEQLTYNENEKMTVLDIGSGTGFLALDVATMWPSATVLAVDIAHGMSVRTMAKKGELSNVRLITGDVECLPFSPGSSTTLVSNLSLQWVVDFSIALRELLEVLQKGGSFFVSLLTAGSLPELKSALRESFPSEKSDALVDTFQAAENIETHFACAGVQEISFLKESWVRHYKDALTFLNSIKHIGANPLGSDANPLGSYREVKELLKYYDLRFSSDGGVQATYEILFIKGKK